MVPAPAGGCLPAGPLVINDVIYAELSERYGRIEDVTEFAAEAGPKHETLPAEALFLAGKAFRSYRRSRGTRTGVLPDFSIGAHAAIIGLPILTRDKGRYLTYFPTGELITP